MPNYSFTMDKPLPDVEDGHRFIHYNFHQALPHTEIFAGKQNLIFEGCNLINCDVPEDAQIIDCSHFQISYCRNSHPDWDLPDEPIDCSHVVDIHEVIIDSVLINYTYEYEDEVVD